jgi:two-component system cell cycle response regulator
LDGAARLADRIREGIERHCIRVSDIAVCVTASIGVAARDLSMSLPDVMLKQADAALYRAKQAGRNRVCAANP